MVTMLSVMMAMTNTVCWPCSKHITWINSFHLHSNLMRQVLLFHFINEELRHREVKCLAQGHTASVTRVYFWVVELWVLLS